MPLTAAPAARVPVMPDLADLPFDETPAIFVGVVLPILVIVVIAIVALRLARLFVHGIVKALLDRETSEGTAQELSAVEVRKRMDTLDQLGSRVIQAFIVIVAGLMILGELGLNIGPAIAGLGVVGIAVGFGAQALVRDYLTGALILVENQYGRGDVVRIAGVSGTVEDFSLRRTTLRDLDGVVHTIPNGEIKVASNLTRVWARINQDVTVAYGTDIEQVIALVETVGQELAADPLWRRRILEPPRVERVDALGEYGITLKILGSVRAAEQWAAGGEFRKRLLAAFTAAGIEIPFPHRVVISRGEPAVAPEELAGHAD
jgi:small-conductance mechanosensitive channel